MSDDTAARRSLSRPEASAAVEHLGWRYLLARFHTGVAVSSPAEAVDVAGLAVRAAGHTTGPAVGASDAPRPQRNRIHVDVTVSHDEAQRRLQAAIDAGGRVLSDARAPAFWVLADPEGNEVCICTWQNRD